MVVVEYCGEALQSTSETIDLEPARKEALIYVASRGMSKP
jgi:hypothetical protein